MNMRDQKFFFGLCILFLFSCSNKNKVYSKFDMLRIAKDAKSEVEFILPSDLNSGIKCLLKDGNYNYGPGCLSAHQLKIGDLDFVAVEFDSEEHAYKEALRLKQCYVRNWLFDEVYGEPSLEQFVKSVFGGTCPSKE